MSAPQPLSSIYVVSFKGADNHRLKGRAGRKPTGKLSRR